MMQWIHRIVFSTACVLGPVILCASTPSPRIFYSDIVSGPASGGQNNLGAIITLTGAGFGSPQGQSQVELAGSPVGRVLLWSDTKVAVQIGRHAQSGKITIVSGGGSSNGVPFTVTPGNIFFVAMSGRDDAAGTWEAPWRTIPHAAAAMRPGDITYVLDRVSQTSKDSYHAALSIENAGTLGKPLALVAYPGAAAVIGDAAGEEFGLRTPAIRGGPFSNWVIAGFVIRGANTALRLNSVSGWRIVNNDFSCPAGDGPAGCLELSGSTGVSLLGNSIHDTGAPNGSKRYQSVYFTTDSNHIDVGWNHIFRNRSCRGIQFHSSPVSADSGFNQYDILIHDNRISDQVCDGINLATIDPSKGRIAVYNNLITHVGVGPSPHDGEANYSCINSPGIVNRGTPGTETVEIFNNTLYDCGSIGGPSAGAIGVGAASPDLLLKNNIIRQVGQPYFTRSSTLAKVHGSGNLWWGGGSTPGVTTANVYADPHFLSDAAEFALAPQSPAKHASKGCAVAYDLAGQSRKADGTCSLGAFE